VTGPLAGVTVVVTRPRAQAARFATLVSEAGATPLLLPALEIEPVELDPAARALLAPDAFDWTIYTSANSVESSLRQLPRPTRTRVAAVGRGTARALADHGVVVHAIPTTTADSEGLLALDAFASIAGQRILILKGEGGRTLLREELERRGATIVTGDLYRRVHAAPGAVALAELGRALDSGAVVVAVTSAESLAALLAAIPDADLPRLRDAALLVPGERVTASARAQRWRGPMHVAASAEDATMAAALVEAVLSGRPPGDPSRA
jgi:uroporphyrinogen-III synthase